MLRQKQVELLKVTNDARNQQVQDLNTIYDPEQRIAIISDDHEVIKQCLL